MGFLDNLKIRNKLILMLLVPALALMFFAGYLLLEKNRKSNEMGQLIALTKLTSSLSALVHETQKERGTSAGFVGSGGKNFADVVPKQRKLTDAKLEQLDLAITEFLATNSEPGVTALINQVQKNLQGLPKMRSEVSALTTSLGGTVGWYTKLNADILAIVEFAPHLVSDAGLVRNLTVYANFLQSKERAGVERAVLSAAFGADKFAPNMFKKFVELVAAQGNYLHVFNALATDQDKAFFTSTMKHESVAEVEKMRQLAFANAAEGGFNTKAEYWFATITKKINLLKQVDDYLAEVVSDQAQKLASQSQYQMILFSAGFVLSLLVALVLSTYISRTVSRSLASMQEAMAKTVEQGDFSVRIENHNNDEIGYMGRSINTLLSSVQEAINSANHVVGKVAIGQFDERINGSYSGDLLLLKNGINSSADGVERTMTALRQVLKAIANGEFAYRLTDKDIEEDFRNTLNTTMEVMQSAIGEINIVMGEASQGNFDKRVQAQLAGDLDTLKSGVNNAVISIAAAIDETCDVAEQMAEGNVTVRINGTYLGRLNDLKMSLNTSLDRLQSTLTNILDNANGVSTGASEISQGSLQLSERTNEQAASLEETAASMSEMTSTVDANAANAQQANKLVYASRSKAKDSVSVVEAAVEAMQAINASSQKIADIIALIYEVAFQTNLLALNASVEAARAGEHGRGFAVVAGEVRTLAQRSAESAKEIRQLIEASNAQVNQGTTLVNDSGAALSDIYDSIETINSLVGEISHASSEQSNSIKQVNQAVSQLDSVNQQNAALVEESTAASDNLASQASELRREIQFFRV